MRMMQTGYQKNTGLRPCIDSNIAAVNFVPKGDGDPDGPERDCIEFEIDGESPDKQDRCRYVFQLSADELLMMLLSLSPEAAERASGLAFLASRKFNKAIEKRGPDPDAVLGALRGLMSLIPVDLE